MVAYEVALRREGHPSFHPDAVDVRVPEHPGPEPDKKVFRDLTLSTTAEATTHGVESVAADRARAFAARGNGSQDYAMKHKNKDSRTPKLGDCSVFRTLTL